MQKNQIPFYGADGRRLGFRTLHTAERLVASGFVKASYGRKKVLRAIWLNEEDGGNPVETQAPTGTRYSFIETLEHGRCYALRRLDQRDEAGRRVSMRPAFLQVVTDCTKA
jgi:hypothetical protein